MRQAKRLQLGIQIATHAAIGSQVKFSFCVVILLLKVFSGSIFFIQNRNGGKYIY